MKLLPAPIAQKVSGWRYSRRQKRKIPIETLQKLREFQVLFRKLEIHVSEQQTTLQQMQQLQLELESKIQRLQRSARQPTTLALEQLHRELEEYNSAFGSSPDTSSQIWNRLCDLHELYIRMNWSDRGRPLNLSRPSTLAEKLEWLKLNDHREVHITMTDKLAVRDYVLSKTNNPALLNCVYGVYKRADEIPIDQLPSKFVLKTNHWSGQNFICRDKSEFGLSERDRFTNMLSSTYARESVEWPYWKIEPKLFVEEYLEDQFSELVDYKVFCFNGTPKLILVCMGRFGTSKLRILYFDSEWKLQPIEGSSLYSRIPAGQDFPRPKSLNEMLQYASLLSQDAAFVRVDWYDFFGECRFGELTLYPDSGVGCVVSPEHWNFVLGSWLHLPKSNRNPWMAYC